LDREELVEEKPTVIVMTAKGYVKRMDASLFKEQKRGGVGIKAIDLREGDALKQVLYANTKDVLLVFTNKGKVYRIFAYEIEEQGRTSRGRSIYSYFGDMQNDELPVRIVNLEKEDFQGGKYLVFLTNKGYVKKVDLSLFSNIRRTGLKAITLKDEEGVSDVRLFDKNSKYALIVSNKGNAIRFEANQIKELSRVAHGIIGMRFKNRDEYAKHIIDVNENEEIVVVLNKGYGKRIKVGEITVHNRGGKGMKLIAVPEGWQVGYAEKVVGEGIGILTKQGLIIKTAISSIPLLSRTARGVRVINLKEGDEVIGGFLY